MQILSQHSLVYLDDATPLLKEVVHDYAVWSKRSTEEKIALTRLVHDYLVGEDWQEEDDWADVEFTPDEIQAFSAHVWVPGDMGLPEWYTPTSFLTTLHPPDHDAPSEQP